MRKYRKYFLFFLLLSFYACSDSSGQLQTMQMKIEKMQKELDQAYKPGFGEFMSMIQVHHAKLWFAGINKNWKLADFEVHEIKETLHDLEKFQAARPENSSLPIIYPALDSVLAAIEKENISSFKKNYTTLTNTCNQCHRSVNYEFNEVKIPDNPPFSNQVFESVDK